MGVDYTAQKGLGFKVNVESSEDPYDFLDRLLLESEEEYSFFDVGDCYGEYPIDYYVVLSNYDLDEKLMFRIEKLKSFLIEKKLISIEESASLVGGLLIH